MASTNRKLSKGQNGLAAYLPLSIGEADGPYNLIRDYESLTKQNLKMLLLTNPGERPMDPRYGVGLLTYLFEQNVEDTHMKLNSEIHKQVERYMPFLSVTNVIQSSLDDENLLLVSIRYYIIPLEKEEILEITVPTG